MARAYGDVGDEGQGFTLCLPFQRILFGRLHWE
jgi:hypothetical protein